MAAAVGDVSAIDTELLTNLATALRSGERTFSPHIEALLAGSHNTAQEDPNWPTLTYLLGEAQRQRGEASGAQETFRSLAVWAASNEPDGPYGDTWGGSGLAVAGLWRWLQLLDEHGSVGSGEVDQALQVASGLQETRLYAGMVQTDLLPAMPLLAEAVAQRLAHIAWKNQRPEATALFLDFLTINSSETLDSIDQEIQAEMFKKKLVDPERLELFRAKRLLNLVKTRARKEHAAETLKQLWENQQTPADVRAEAGYEWANFKRRQRDKQDVVTALDGVLELAGDGLIAEKALYRRGTVYNREPADTEAFRADMLEMLHRFPHSQLADDALYQLATDYLFELDLDSALTYYEKLRNFQGYNDYQDSAYYLPALGLIGRGHASDLDTAEQLLSTYVTQYPNGVFRLRSLFWQGRIAGQRNDSKLARELFQQLIAEAPYDYYAVRARMHLEEGRHASVRDLPEPNSQVFSELFTLSNASRIETKVTGDSPYHSRLRAAAQTGLYRQLLEVERGLSERLDDIPLEQLDVRHLTASTVLLLSLRQDALAAKDVSLTADNWIQLAGLLGHAIQDWPLALEVPFIRGRVLPQRRTTLQEDPRYLATVYPKPTDLSQLKQSLVSAAWKIDDSFNLSQSLMYAVIRHESRFYPRAISSAGGLGFFQFMPGVFQALDRRWKLLEESGIGSSVEYLFDPEKNAQLWKRWVNDEFSIKHRGDVVTTLMKHHASSGNVRRWNTYWEKVVPQNDLEYKIETARFNATRNFVRRVLRDITIVEAAQFFGDDAASSG